MATEKKKVLLIVESCNPELSSVPLVGYNFFKAISNVANVHLATHCRNRDALTRSGVTEDVTYYEETNVEKIYYRIISFLSSYRGRIIWPLRHALQFPIYFFFDRFIYKKFSSAVSHGSFDIVHTMTPILPRYPYKISKACKSGAKHTPFVLGPVNGGVPYPDAFKSISNREFGYLNWIRRIGAAVVPGYRQTYNSADKILAGSTYTANWVRETFPENAGSVQLLYENGVPESFYRTNLTAESPSHNHDPVRFRLLFIGRLEPYKGCDMLLEAYGKISESVRRNLELTIVGDGSERENLESMARQLGIMAQVNFRGWLDHALVQEECANANLFCFPSVREFGGAVVMEAMAAGLPCIVVDNGGIGEYVTSQSGVKLAPLGRAHVVDRMVKEITLLTENRPRYQKMVEATKERAKEFSWSYKGQALATIYDQLTEAVASS